MKAFTSFWHENHPSGPPIAHILRKVEEDNWVRFHSLPFSKRYAETPRERWTVLERANTLASRILGESAECWLVQADPSYGDAANDPDQHSSIRRFGLSFALEHEDAEDECTYAVYVGLVRWTAGAFNGLIAQRADDLLPVPTMWVSARTGAAFAPYDGGSDLFLTNAGEVAELKHQYSDWLSNHPNGL